MPVADVLLISKWPLRHRHGTAEREPPLSKVKEVAPGIYLAGVHADVAHTVIHACKFRSLEPDEDRALYGFVRDNPPGETWDEDGALSKALYLSHFVHAHIGGFEFAARIETDARRRVLRLQPADIGPSFARAYCCSGVNRPWLTQEDGDTLRDLIAAYDNGQQYLKGSRLGTAVSLYAESPFVFHGRPRATLLATALEGSVSTRPERAVKQFTVRTPALAAAVGLPRLDKSWASATYKLRSKLAHGAALLHSVHEEERRVQASELNAAMTEMDELLRRILVKALLDRSFAETVENIDSHWPVPGKGCPACRRADATLLEVQCPRCDIQWR